MLDIYATGDRAKNRKHIPYPSISILLSSPINVNLPQIITLHIDIRFVSIITITVITRINRKL